MLLHMGCAHTHSCVETSSAEGKCSPADRTDFPCVQSRTHGCHMPSFVRSFAMVAGMAAKLNASTARWLIFNRIITINCKAFPLPTGPTHPNSPHHQGRWYRLAVLAKAKSRLWFIFNFFRPLLFCLLLVAPGVHRGKWEANLSFGFYRTLRAPAIISS